MIKKCSRCGLEKTLDAYQADKRYRGGYRGWCKACYSAYKKERRVHYQEYERKSKYGCSPEDQRAIFAKQDGKCAGCKRKLDGGKFTHLDHCHATGKVRGFLCGGCNRALGGVEDDIERLRGLIAYLENA